MNLMDKLTRSMPFFVAAILLIALRLGIWKIFPLMEFSVKDEFANMIMAGLIFLLAVLFYGMKLMGREGFVKSGLEAPLALFVVVSGISLMWTADVSATASAVIMLLSYVLFFFMLTELLQQEKLRQIFFWFFVAASVVVGLIGINDIIYLSSVPPQTVEQARLTNESLYYILIHKRACSLFGWPNVLAGFLMLGMPLVTGLFFTLRHWAWKAVCVMSFGVMLVAFFFTYSFLGWSVFLFTVIFGFVLLWRSGLLKVPPAMVKWVLVAAVLFGALFAVVIIRKDFGSSMTPRKEYMRVVGSVIAEYPWRGGGFGAYRAVSLQYVKDREGVTGFAHNAYLQIWAETGIVGLAAIIWMLWLLGRASWRAWGAARAYDQKVMLAAVLCGMLAFLIDNLNSFTMLKPNSSFFFWTWLAVVCSFVSPGEECQGFLKRYARPLMAAFVVVALAGCYAAWRCGSYLFLLQSGTQSINAGRLKDGRETLKRAQAFDPLDVRVWTVLGTSYVMEFQVTQQKDALEKARQVFEQAAQTAPRLYYSYLILSRIHAAYGDTARASELQQKAMALSPYEAQRDILQSQGGQRGAQR
jgi:O-antigen ligase